jgi:hypothetical protein
MADDPKQKACEYALEFTKQLLTLGAAAIAFVVSVAFSDHAGALSVGTVKWSLLWLGLSMTFGFLVMGQVIGRIEREGSFSVFGGFLQVAALLQVICFLGGVISLFGPACAAASRPHGTEAKAAKTEISAPAPPKPPSLSSSPAQPPRPATPPNP